MSNANTVVTQATHLHKARHERLLAINNLSINYGNVRACHNINLDIPKAEITAVIGPSGCGKSTLIHTLNRITDHIPNCRVDGEILFKDQNILEKDICLSDLRKKIACVFQKPTPFPFSIYKNFAIPLKEHGIKAKTTIMDTIEQSLSRVGLWHEVKDRLNKPATQLSGGQQQRLIIARALALKPEVILMDEPCSALDPISTRKIEELVVELKEQFTFVIVTHNIAQAKRISDNIALFWQKNNCGYLHAEAKTEQFFSSPPDKLSESYILGHQG